MGGMSRFVLAGSDVFGRYCRIEQLRYGSPNDVHLYKVVASLRSNMWCEVPYKTASAEVLHDSIEDCVLAIRCGIDETEVQRFRLSDIEFVPEKACDRDALLALAGDMEAEASASPLNATPDCLAMYARLVRAACGEGS